MHTVTSVALVMWLVSFTVLVCGIACKANGGKDDMVCAGFCMLVACLLLSIGFSVGAFWQRDDTMEKYELLLKIHNTPPKP